MTALTPGDTLARYRLRSVLGSGGMGVVYLADDMHLNRRVAVKVLSPARFNPESRARLRAEALALSSLNHQNVATVYDFGCEAETDYLVMEFVPGQNLDELLADAPFASDYVAAIGVQLARGLAAAHAEGIIHRDIKPANLRLTADGLLKILDFGVATSPSACVSTKTTESAVGHSRMLAGTLQYMSAERLRGAPADARSDIFSAGVVMYEMACGRPPFAEEQPIRLIEQILNGRVTRPRKINPKIDPSLEMVLLRALNAEPTQRYAGARELAAALEPLTVDRTVAVPELRPIARSFVDWMKRLAAL
jgi:serine/threonine-protein kinase